ncbi:hypothetical protein GLOTRDRAFT_128727 [Gloeophyllum trabeum ATCC 11539]|uniref:Cyclin N-terminal domain-containing protein n=1 Tax=Gloeophyllum trabeum (strain ATCC 11539 / FP-39264 / Madison 617) TaxID=670483 RepID=S7Q644_GLOTA|nr:uncharacterized protein GLOTRDRAFT_128727 [Gloeophyllum trabeum ATCC 11539]EPQ55496.1 hypothetical protein GLOTRDRAFT_128727 [Gloeophyllum trabeum ATCC 11539]
MSLRTVKYDYGVHPGKGSWTISENPGQDPDGWWTFWHLERAPSSKQPIPYPMEPVMEWMRKTEVQTLPNRRRIEMLQPDWQWGKRRLVMLSIHNLHHQMRLNPQTLQLACALIDRLLSLKRTSPEDFPVLAVAALFAAANRLEEVDSPARFCEFCPNFKPEEVERWRFRLVEALGDTLSVRCPDDWLQYYQERGGKWTEKEIAISRFLVKMAYLYEDFIGVLPSTMFWATRYVAACILSPDRVLHSLPKEHPVTVAALRLDALLARDVKIDGLSLADEKYSPASVQVFELVTGYYESGKRLSLLRFPGE